MEHILSLEEISWRQKSRMLCIKKEDNNTKFFHKVANSHRRYNHLSILEVDGMIYEESEVVAQVVQFYKIGNGSCLGGGLLWRVWSLIKSGEWREVGLKGSLRKRRFFRLLETWKGI